MSLEICDRKELPNYTDINNVMETSTMYNWRMLTKSIVHYSFKPVAHMSSIIFHQ